MGHRALNELWPDALVLFAGLPPMDRFPLPPQPLKFALGLRAATLDRIARTVLAPDGRAFHVPTSIDPGHDGFCADGFHPSAESCTLWAEELARELVDRLAEQLAGQPAEKPTAIDTRRTAR